MYGILSVEINYACGRLGVTAEYPATSIIFFFLNDDDMDRFCDKTIST